MAANKAYLSIGDVLTMLRAEFPDVTISKIRFLESQGLVNPERSPSGYRKFYSHDVERLRWVLRQQRENFLPLKVIRDRLAKADGAIPEDDLTDDEVQAAGDPSADVQAGDGADDDDGGADDDRVSAPVVPINRNITALGTNGRSGRPAESDPSGPGYVAGPGAGAIGVAGVVDRTGTHPGHLAPDGTAPDEHRGSPVPVGAGVGTPGPSSRLSASGGDPAPSSGGPSVRGVGGRGETPTATGDRGGSPRVRGSAREAGGSAAGSAGAGPVKGSAGPGSCPGPEPVVAGASAAAAGAGGSGSAGGGRSGKSGPGQPGKGGGKSPTPKVPAASPGDGALGDEDFEVAPGLSGVSLTLEELCAASAMADVDIALLEGFGLIEPMTIAGVVYYDEEALTVARLAAGFAQFGIEPRHLRLYRNAVDREVGLVEQVVTPMLRQRNPEARQRAVEAVKELARLGQGLRSSILRRELRRQLGG